MHKIVLRLLASLFTSPEAAKIVILFVSLIGPLSQAQTVIPANAKPGTVVNVERLKELTKTSIDYYRSQFDLEFPQGEADLIYRLRRFKITYATTDSQGKLVLASGLLMIPKAEQSYSLLSYQHGTTLTREESPSNLNQEMLMVAIAMASRGFVVAAADYLGFGESVGPHLYHHAQTEATASADLLRAVRGLQSQLQFSLNSELYLTGYSQGGHATIALQRHLEKNLAQEFKITASAPMAGPYNLEKIFLDLIRNPVQRSSGELAYMVHAMQSVYGTIGAWDQIFAKKYADVIPKLFNGEHDWDVMRQALPFEPRHLFNREFIKLYRENPQHPLRVALRENSFFGLDLNSPTKIIYGRSDQEVPFIQSVNLAQRLRRSGSEQISTVSVRGNHESAAPESIYKMIKWFLQIHEQQKSLIKTCRQILN